MKKIIIITAAMVVVIVLAVFGYNYLSKNYKPAQQEKTPQSSQGEKAEPIEAPDFTFYNNQQEKVKLSDYRGKAVILNFWASWCPPCKREMPDFQEAYDKYGQQVEFLMVNLTDGQRETVDSANKFISDSGYTFPVYYDNDMEGAYTYDLRSVPRTVVIDADGNIVNIYYSMVDYNTLESAISDLTD